MHTLRERVLSGDFLAGAWCNIGSSITAEMTGLAGFDWVLFDQEHGPGDSMTLLHQLQAVAPFPTAPLVRIAWNEMPRFKRALDLGAAGLMVPYVQTPEEAAAAVASMRYPPKGQRGVASSPRAAGYGRHFPGYFDRANQELVTVVQVETAETLKHLEAIAAIDGVDVLFVGPLDLSVSCNTPDRFQDRFFVDILKQVGATARDAGKAAGILLPGSEQLPLAVDLGFSFVALGSDGGFVQQGLDQARQAMSASAASRCDTSA